MLSDELSFSVSFEQACLLKDLIGGRIEDLNSTIARYSSKRLNYRRDDVISYQAIVANLQFQLDLMQDMYNSLVSYIGRLMLVRRVLPDVVEDGIQPLQL